MSRFVFICLAFAMSGIARADDGQVLVRVVTTDGKPAAAAKVWVYKFTRSNETPTEPTPLVADDAGKVTVPGGPNARTTRQLFVRDAAGRVGWAWINTPWAEPADEQSVEVVLIATTSKAGRVTTTDGKPIAGALVTPLDYNAEQRESRGQGGPASSIPVPGWELSRLAVKTDSEGRFKLAAPTGGYSVSYRVKAEGFGESHWVASSGVDLDTPLTVPGAITITIDGLDPTLLKGRDWQLSVIETTARSRGINPVRWRSGTFDGTTKITVRDVVVGRYELTAPGGGKFPGVLKEPVAVEVASGKTVEITARFGPGAKVTGRVTDANGQGVAKVHVGVQISDVPGPQPRKQLVAETDSAGKFTVHGPAGWYTVWLQRLPDGYAQPVPLGPERRLVEPAKVEVGKEHAFAPIALLKTVSFSGQIVFPDGKPAAGATVSTWNLIVQGRGEGKLTADKDGRFTIPNLPPDDAVAPRIRLGKAVNVPETYALEKTTQPVTITISETNATTFKGRVVDTKGKPVAGARVSVRQSIQGVGRNSSYGTSGCPAMTTTDAEGRYEFAGMWTGDEYRVVASLVGYSEAESKEVRGESGVCHDFGDLKLTRSALTVNGIVVERDGKPVTGAEVFGVDGPSPLSTVSAADGSFTLTGFYESGGFVFARKAGFRLVAVPVTPGNAKPTTITLAKADGLPVPPPEMPASHQAALDSLTRHALTLVWENHVTFGYGGNVLEDMAHIDPATARRWRDEEKKRTDGKTDFTRIIDRVERQKTLFNTAKDDPDEALAIIVALKPSDGFDEAKRIGEQMLSVDKAKALRFAEEAVVKARQLELPARIWSLAEAGDLAIRAGNAAGGKKVLAEAAELAAKLTPQENGWNSLAVGLVAAHLAPYDWDRAESLLNTLTAPSEFNRFLSATTARVARTDLARAKQLLSRFKPENSSYPQIARLRVGYAVATTQPDEAVKLIESIEKGPYRFLGYIRLATEFAPTDKGRAVKLVDTAFDLLDSNPEAFRSWGNYGGRAGFAIVGAVRAKEIGHPDVPQLVAHCLAMGPAQDAWSPNDREQRIVNFAAVLALIDPPAARQVLATLGSPEELVQRGVTQRRDWLFALALADPSQATQLADRLIQRAKEDRGGQNALSATGLVELGTILTAKDRLRELARYGSLPREIDKDD